MIKMVSSRSGALVLLLLGVLLHIGSSTPGDKSSSHELDLNPPGYEPQADFPNATFTLTPPPGVLEEATHAGHWGQPTGPQPAQPWPMAAWHQPTATQAGTTDMVTQQPPLHPLMGQQQHAHQPPAHPQAYYYAQGGYAPLMAYPPAGYPAQLPFPTHQVPYPQWEQAYSGYDHATHADLQPAPHSPYHQGQQQALHYHYQQQAHAAPQHAEEVAPPPPAGMQPPHQPFGQVYAAGSQPGMHAAQQSSAQQPVLLPPPTAMQPSGQGGAGIAHPSNAAAPVAPASAHNTAASGNRRAFIPRPPVSADAAEVQRLRAALHQSREEHRRDVERLEGRVEQLEDDVAELDNHVAELQDDVAERDNRIAALKSQVDGWEDFERKQQPIRAARAAKRRGKRPGSRSCKPSKSTGGHTNHQDDHDDDTLERRATRSVGALLLTMWQ